MRVKRNFEKLYERTEDPWNIGDAVSERYKFYYLKTMEMIPKKGDKLEILDIGSGFGAFLSHFHEDGKNELYAVELSSKAVEKGRGKYPYICFFNSSAQDIKKLPLREESLDLIICSDVVCYLGDRDKVKLIDDMYALLKPEGTAFVAGWSPGGRYLTPEELRKLVAFKFIIVDEALLESGHACFWLRKRYKKVIITIDYETWHPIPAGKRIDWEKDIFQPTAQLMNMAESCGAVLTFMVEMGEYYWLKEHYAAMAEEMEEQWRSIVRRGHDIQLHLHPGWLPESGARHDPVRGYSWDRSKNKADDYPGDLASLIARCKDDLERVLLPVQSACRVNAFRAGAYQVQPFRRLAQALKKCGIKADTSVFQGGCSKERGYDFRLAYSSHQPYWANPYDPQLLADPGRRFILEFPVFAPFRGKRWCLDGSKSRYIERNFARVTACPSAINFRFRRIGRFFLNAARFAYQWLNRAVPRLNCLIPRKVVYPLFSSDPVDYKIDDYYLMIGHTKADLDYKVIEENLCRLARKKEVRFISLGRAVEEVWEKFSFCRQRLPREEMNYQVRREYKTVLGERRNRRQSFYLQRKVPFDRKRILDFGCGAGHWSYRLSRLLPWARVAGVDCGADFIAKARNLYQSERVNFILADFTSLDFPGGSFDCVYADNSLEHAYDADKALCEIYRLLCDGGVLVAAVPADARNPGWICDNHTWKTDKQEILLRLQNAGFNNIEIEEVDTYKKFFMPPYPPSKDVMLCIKAWKRKDETGPLGRVKEIMSWVYDNLSPERPHLSGDPEQVLLGGYAWCDGYSRVMQHICRREGFKTRRAGFFMKPHPRGRGKEKIDSHTLLEVWLEGKWQLFDPTANVYFGGLSLKELINNPTLADDLFAGHKPDPRWLERRYDLYCTGFAFKIAYKVWYEKGYRKILGFIRKL
ncbi:MAG: methyltransferase domain-containing protein [Peptococcaceae bacterium]|nr:MAG: methyltransferase domain-containing protein [Peptococcaceae bacterium]